VADDIEQLRNYPKTGVVQHTRTITNDIVTRLRDVAGDWDHVGLIAGDDLRAAADEIKQLRTVIIELRGEIARLEQVNRD
jgi:hypothetical protein